MLPAGFHAGPATVQDNQVRLLFLGQFSVLDTVSLGPPLQRQTVFGSAVFNCTFVTIQVAVEP